MPPKPTAPTAIPSQNCGLAKAVTSVRQECSRSAGKRGTAASTSAAVSSPSAATAQ